MTMHHNELRITDDQRVDLKTRIQAFVAKHNISYGRMGILLGISDTSLNRYVREDITPRMHVYRNIQHRLLELESMSEKQIYKQFAVTSATRVPANRPAHELIKKFVDTRLAARITQAEAAKLIGVSKSCMSVYEQGGSTRISDDDIRAFIDVYSTANISKSEEAVEEDIPTPQPLRSVPNYDAALRAETSATIYELAALHNIAPDKALRLIRQFLEFSISEGVDFVAVVNAFNP